MGREGRNDAVEIARREKNRWKKRALRAEATLGKVLEYVPSLPTNRAQADLRAILDESPTELETPADTVATVVAAWRGVGKGPKIPALSNLAAALDRLAEAYGEVVSDDRA